MRRIHGYIWERSAWPGFNWDAEALLSPLGEARLLQGRLRGETARVGLSEQVRAYAAALTEEALETSQIEGEYLDGAAVRSSVARRLGLEDAGVAKEDARADGVVEITYDATRRFAEPLTIARLHRWHRSLFPSAGKHIGVGHWRDDRQGPVQVVSGRIDRPKVHYQAPPAERIEREMRRFLAWFNGEHAQDGLFRAAVAHFWFVTLHPYDDGNGRIARAIADMALARDEGTGERFFSMSRQIRVEKSAYYAVLERVQSGDVDITDWLRWFLGCYARAAEHALTVIADVSRASRFWQAYGGMVFSERQKIVLNRFLHQFEGKLTAKKWAALAKTSVDTAQRDITDLLGKGVLTKGVGGSKNTSYEIAPFS